MYLVQYKRLKYEFFSFLHHPAVLMVRRRLGGMGCLDLHKLLKRAAMGMPKGRQRIITSQLLHQG